MENGSWNLTPNYIPGLGGQSGGTVSIGGLQQANRPDGNLQGLSAENAAKAKQLNQRLADIRGRMFGEAEASKDCLQPGDSPMPSMQGSLNAVNDELLEAFRQLDSIICRPARAEVVAIWAEVSSNHRQRSYRRRPHGYE